MLNNREQKKYGLLAEVASAYYERGLNQDEIAKMINLSRTRVSRLLKEAADAGVVQFTINYSFDRQFALEEHIKDMFPVKEVRILNNRSVPADAIGYKVGSLATDYIVENLKKDMILGTGYGITMSEVVRNLQPATLPMHVVQLMGSVNLKSSSHTPQGIVATMADKFQCQGTFLNLPLYIEDDKIRDTLTNETGIRRVLNEGMFADMIMTGITSLQDIADSSPWMSYMTPALYNEAIEKGAVGAFFARFFDANGHEVDCSWNKRVVSISLDHLKEVPDVVVVGYRPAKADAIKYALKAGLINTLIIDSTTAGDMLHRDVPSVT